MSRSGLSSPQYYTWDIGVEAGLPLLLQDISGSYIYGPGGMLLEEVAPDLNSDSLVPYYYHTDRLGSVRALTSSSGAVVKTYTYDAYGKTLTSVGLVSNPFGYTGEYTDSESGLIYLRARYYDPETQQFMSVDPALAWTEEAYAYAGGSPTNFRDPAGLQTSPQPPINPWQLLMDKLFGPFRGTVTGPFTGRIYDARLVDQWSAGNSVSRLHGMDYHINKWSPSGASPEEWTLRATAFRNGYGPSGFCEAVNDPGAVNPGWSNLNPGWRIQLPSGNGTEVGWYSMEDGTIQTYYLKDSNVGGPSAPNDWVYQQLLGEAPVVDEMGNPMMATELGDWIQVRLPFFEGP